MPPRVRPCGKSVNIDQKPMIRIMFIRHPRALGAPQAFFAILLLAGIATALVAAFATSA